MTIAASNPEVSVAKEPRLATWWQLISSVVVIVAGGVTTLWGVATWTSRNAAKLEAVNARITNVEETLPEIIKDLSGHSFRLSNAESISNRVMLNMKDISDEVEAAMRIEVQHTAELKSLEGRVEEIGRDVKDILKELRKS